MVRSFVATCSQCKRPTEVRVGTPAREAPKELLCAHCGHTQRLGFGSHFGPEARLDGCPVCDYHTLAIQKDVNGKLGVLAVLAVFGTLLLLRVELPWMLGILVVFAVLDWLLLRLLVKRLLICYRCKSLFRGFPAGPSCRPFDLATWEAHD
ncbi:MAG: hypothetical protein ACT4PU_13120 [Planctomycetota bacterium]